MIGTIIIWVLVGLGGIGMVVLLIGIAGGGLAVGSWQLSNGKHTRDQDNYMNNVVAPSAEEQAHNSIHWDPGGHH